MTSQRFLSLRRLGQGATATRSLAGGAAVAVARDSNCLAFDLRFKQVREVHALAPLMLQREIEHLVEIAVIDIAAPIYRDQATTHDMLQIAIEMSVSQQIEVALELAFRDQDRAETLDRHVGEGEKPIEDDSVALTEHVLVVGFERLLRGRQDRPLR